MSVTAALAGAASAGEIASLSTSILASIFGKGTRKYYSSMISKLSKALAENETLLNKLTQAYNNRNTQAMNALLMSSPVGVAYERIQSQINNMTNDYNEKVAKLAEDRSRLNEAYNEASNQKANASSSLTGLVTAHLAGNKSGSAATQSESALQGHNILSQTINGGMNNVQG